uniref:Zinc finger and SCAN domain-containing protein 2 n=1 Tax=Cacopsylla melanoneura TaxID=428564 RepID=A0A8D9B1P6_9HEMI
MIIKLPRDQLEIIEIPKVDHEEVFDETLDSDLIKLEEESSNNISENYHNQLIDFEELKSTTRDDAEEMEDEKPRTIESVEQLEIKNPNLVADFKIEDEDPQDNAGLIEYNHGNYGSDAENKFEDDWTDFKTRTDVPRDDLEIQHDTGKENTIQNTFVTKREHQCTLCETSFSYKPSLVRHMNVVHFNKFQCSMCKQSLSSSPHLRNHMLKDHNHLLLFCPLCQEEFTTTEDMNTHMSHVHAQTAHVCHKCRRVYTSREHLYTHLKACKRRKLTEVKCESCWKVFTSKITMERHLEVHMGVRYNCKQCEKIFSNERSLFRHKLISHSGNVYKCNACNKKFADDTGLIRHNRTVHRTATKKPVKYSCDRCGKSYVDKKSLREHLNSVHYGLNYTCALCDKTFNTKTPFQNHQRKHKLYQFNCHHCEKIFVDQKSLDKHRRIESILNSSFSPKRSTKKKKASYTCVDCGLSFTKKLKLKCHIQGYHMLRVDLGKYLYSI